MPIYSFYCQKCTDIEDHFWHTWKNAPMTWPCMADHCGFTRIRVMAQSAPALWFEEGRGRWINNLTDQPQYVTSKAQLRQLEKKHGVVNASTDDLLYNKTRRALDARRESPHSLKDAFRKAVESL